MSRIRQLDAHVVNRIAAGEVVERPASVVKEMLENSVDALSTRIEVDIAAGGTELIRIVDDGEGIHPDDMRLAVTSHATSKIVSDTDLDEVATLGFRGEALASIASVSRFRIRSRQSDAENGTELQCEGGEIRSLQPCGCPAGTLIEVRNLFFNTPARRRFLRKPSTEFGQISEQFSRIALANPRLHMVLRHNDKVAYELPSAASQEDRIRSFFGSDLADQLIPVESETNVDGRAVRLWGFVGEPSVSRSTRRNQYLFLNGRWIQDRSLQHALQEAYRGLLMVGRHPVSFLFLELPPDLVDVNVHPTKSEVRFRDSQSLYRQLLHMLRDRFMGLNFRSELRVEGASDPGAAAPLQRVPEGSTAAKELDLWADQALPARPPRIGIRPGSFDPDAHGTRRRSGMSEFAAVTSTGIVDDAEPVGGKTEAAIPGTETEAEGSRNSALQSDAETEASQSASADSIDDRPAAGSEPEVFRAFQIYDCYLVVAGPDGLEIIDQHALHERIMYEHLRTRILSGAVERQKLLIPETIECSAPEAAALAEHEEVLREAGFELQEFGGGTVLLTACPVLMPKGSLGSIVRDLAGKLLDSDGRTSRRDLLDSMLHTMSCRAAIKAGQRLTPEEMQELLQQRHLVRDSHHCPHGRPTAMTLSRSMLDKQFGRLG